MRADRLLSLLMLLQTRGRMTAEALARELAVSPRTIYRDLEALGAVGVPVYAEPGPGGGYGLVDSYRTTLTGLTQDELRALFMLSIPAPLTELGVSQELRMALLKLAAALPGPRREEELRVRQRIYLDPAGWFHQEENIPHLRTIHQAVWTDRTLRLTSRLSFDTQLERVVAPYGLVAKNSVWYLVFAQEGSIRVQRVSEVVDALIRDEPFERPADFDLSAFWQAWCADVENHRPTFSVMVRAAPDLIPALRQRIGKADAEPDSDGWVRLTLLFETFESARRYLLSWGRAVEVLEPLPLRKSVLDFARQIVDYYDRR